MNLSANAGHKKYKIKPNEKSYFDRAIVSSASFRLDDQLPEEEEEK